MAPKDYNCSCTAEYTTKKTYIRTETDLSGILKFKLSEEQGSIDFGLHAIFLITTVLKRLLRF